MKKNFMNQQMKMMIMKIKIHKNITGNIRLCKVRKILTIINYTQKQTIYKQFR